MAAIPLVIAVRVVKLVTVDIMQQTQVLLSVVAILVGSFTIRFGK